jgi:hypothetical protein
VRIGEALGLRHEDMHLLPHSRLNPRGQVVLIAGQGRLSLDL